MTNLTYKLKSKKIVDFELLSGRIASVCCSTNFIKEIKNKREIDTIIYDEEFTITIGDELNFKINDINSNFKIKKIIKNTLKGRYYLLCDEDNFTNYFIFPLIVDNAKQNSDWFNLAEFTINSYLSENLNSIYVIARYFNTDRFKNWETKIKSNENYFKFFDPSPNTVGYEFKIPEIFIPDLELFLDGKYSQMSDLAKNRITKFHNASKKGNLYGILHKTIERKKQLEEMLGIKLPDNIDLHSKPNLENEIYRGLF